MLWHYTFCTSQHNNLFQHIKSKTHIWYVTDSGADDGLGYFGWAITTNTTILVEGYGQAQGNLSQAKSLQSESYGRILLMSFIKSYKVYYNVTDIPETQNYYCDNITFVKHIIKNKATMISPTNHTLAKYDDQMTMNALLKNFHERFIIITLKDTKILNK
eukprot:8147646-Ditylum_brightwellii.AAC.1